ncbi:MAG TPA: GNAT family N-acetyltransferase [Actinomycetales bacterium]
MRAEPFDLLAATPQAAGLRVEALRTVTAVTGRGILDAPSHFAAHAERPRFRAVAVHEGGELAGFGYGYEEQPGSWWRARVEPALDRVGAARLLDGAFCLVELHVRPALHRSGIGRVLLRDLLDGLPHPRVLLSTQDGPNPARGFYRRLGLRDVAPVDMDGVPYLVLTADLPLGGRRE